MVTFKHAHLRVRADGDLMVYLLVELHVSPNSEALKHALVQALAPNALQKSYAVGRVHVHQGH